MNGAGSVIVREKDEAAQTTAEYRLPMLLKMISDTRRGEKCLPASILFAKFWFCEPSHI